MQQEIPARLTTLVKECFPGWSVEECIGTGSYSRVYRIRQKDGLSSDSALKWVEYTRDNPGIAEILKRGASEKDVAEYLNLTKTQLQREIQAMDRLRGNSYIVNMDDHRIVDREDGSFDLLIRMEYLTPLPALTGDMTVQDVRQVGLDICSALIDCEKEGIAHRDIKPANIFRNRQGRYKLGDFGVAKLLNTQREAVPQGTPLYMAPEVYQSKPHSSQKADLYSLGLVLYELLNAQHPPFTPLYNCPPTVDQEEESVRQRMSGKDLPSPLQGTRKLNLIIHRASSFDEEDRYDSAAEMFDELQSLDLASTGAEKLNSFSDLPSPPPDVQGTAARDGGQDRKQTEKSSPSETNPLTRSAADLTGRSSRNKHSQSQTDDADDETIPPSKGSGDTFNVGDVIRQQENEKEKKIKKRKKRKILLIVSAVILAIAAGVVFLMINMSQLGSLSFSQNGTEATITWRGGSGPWEVSVLRDNKIIFSDRVQERKAIFRLAPGYDYTLQVGDQTLQASMQELQSYTGKIIDLEKVKLQYKIMEDGSDKWFDSNKIEYHPLIGQEGKEGYRLRIVYETTTEEETQAICFLISDGYQEMINVPLTPWEDFLHFSDISLNATLQMIGSKATYLEYKIYVEDMLMTEGKYTIEKRN